MLIYTIYKSTKQNLKYVIYSYNEIGILKDDAQKAREELLKFYWKLFLKHKYRELYTLSLGGIPQCHKNVSFP